MAAVNLAFLQGMKLNEVEEKQTQTRVSKQNNPEPTSMRIRVHKDGSIYPSQALVTALSLEYPKVKVTITPKEKDGESVLDAEQKPVMERSYDYGTSMSMALDVIDTKEWSQYPEGQPRIILVGVSPRRTGNAATPKVDMFASTKYKDDGTPITSVMDQGATTYGKETLLPLLKEVYGIEIGEQGYLDLDIATDYPITTSQGIYLLPKKITMGKHAGKADYEKRENIKVYPLVPTVDEASTEESSAFEDTELTDSQRESSEESGFEATE